LLADRDQFTGLPTEEAPTGECRRHATTIGLSGMRLDQPSAAAAHLKGLCRRQMPEPLDFALIRRLREVRDHRPATEAELRALTEQAEAWARTVNGQIQSSERRLRRLNNNPASSLTQIAGELRRVEKLRPQLNEVRSLLSDLEHRARELRTEWLLSQATSASRRSTGRRS
jgi:hypothetical protein